VKVWTKHKARRSSRAKIAKAKKLIAEICYLWGDFDNYLVSCCGEIDESLDDLNGAIDDTVDGYEA